MRYTAELIGANFKTPPYEHQLREFEEHAEAPARALAWSMRTGKSKSCIDRACHLYQRGLIDAVLIFAPNGVHHNWIAKEFPAHAWDGVPLECLVWRSADNSKRAANKITWNRHIAWEEQREAWYARLKLMRKSRKLFVLSVNTESMTRKDVRAVVARFIKHRRVLVVFDESDDWGTPGSKRTKMARALARKCPFRIIMSGTIIGSSPLAAFSQYELLKPGALGFEKYAPFKDHIAITEDAYFGNRKFPKIIGFKNEDDLRERMAKWTSVVLRDDCHDMPDLIPGVVNIVPTEEQFAAYRDLHEDFILSLGDQTVSVGERAQRFGKMQQVFSGFVIDERKKVRFIPGENPRLDALSEHVYAAPGKVIIWCQFQADIDLVKARMLADGVKFVEYHGRVSNESKLKSLRTFAENREYKALIGHVQSGGRGVDMSAASHIFNYSHTQKARMRLQALERATAIGGKNIHYFDFIAPGPDRAILTRTNSRIDIADIIAGRGLRDFLRELAV